MSTKRYKFTCNLLVEPPKIDRFYMDMRVYSVVPQCFPSVEAKESLVWRGIYLAFEVNDVAGQS
ncbi:MAG: hypothetical protein O3A51_01425 [Verrucomicrobia bacterium]|nr:hypothetical protein [Verrucomicrobiota bacterium]